MVDDGEKAHISLMGKCDLKRETHASKETKGLDDDSNPMNMINTMHRHFKRFVSRHGSYNRDDIEDWCNLFSFIYNHDGKVAEMVKGFLAMAILTRKIMRYRDIISKK